MPRKSLGELGFKFITLKLGEQLELDAPFDHLELRLVPANYTDAAVLTRFMMAEIRIGKQAEGMSNDIENLSAMTTMVAEQKIEMAALFQSVCIGWNLKDPESDEEYPLPREMELAEVAQLPIAILEAVARAVSPAKEGDGEEMIPLKNGNASNESSGVPAMTIPAPVQMPEGLGATPGLDRLKDQAGTLTRV